MSGLRSSYLLAPSRRYELHGLRRAAACTEGAPAIQVPSWPATVLPGLVQLPKPRPAACESRR